MAKIVLDQAKAKGVSLTGAVLMGARAKGADTKAREKAEKTEGSRVHFGVSGKVRVSSVHNHVFPRR